MSTVFKYSSYSHDANECLVTFFGSAPIYNPRGRPQFLRKRMVVEGEIIGGTEHINARMQEMIAAYAVNGGTAELTSTTANTSAYTLGSPGSISGVRVVQPPTFLQQDGKAHLVTGLPFTIVLECDYQINDGDPLVTYSESITHIGNGGPRRVTLELDSGTPIEQIVSQNTPVTVIQAGEAVGSLSYPIVNPPIFATQVDLPDGLAITAGTPRLEGNTWVDWPIRWQYRMTLLSFANIPYPLLR